MSSKRPPGTDVPDARVPRRGPHSQYLMTAMLTGAVQVTATSGCSDAIAEERRTPPPRGPRGPSCSRAVQSASGPAHVPPLSQ